MKPACGAHVETQVAKRRVGLRGEFQNFSNIFFFCNTVGRMLEIKLFLNY